MIPKRLFQLANPESIEAMRILFEICATFHISHVALHDDYEEGHRLFQSTMGNRLLNLSPFL